MAFDISKFAGSIKPMSESDIDMEWIATECIHDNPWNFYPKPNNEELADLMESIQVNGLIEPPTVVQDYGGAYRLISGHSRMEAIRLLAQSDIDRFGHVLCRVLPPMTEVRERCAIVEANRQRKKSDALLAKEAESLTENYRLRIALGEDLPGKIRDRVAADLGVSATKLANLKIISDGLKVPGFQRDWKENRIPESVALEIARMDRETQYRFLDWTIDRNSGYTAKEVKAFLKSREPAPEPKPAPLPDLVPKDITQSGWRPLEADSWPEEGQLVVLSYKTGLGGRGYQAARCAGGFGDRYPFIDPGNGGLSVDEMDELAADLWLAVEEPKEEEHGDDQ